MECTAFIISYGVLIFSILVGDVMDSQWKRFFIIIIILFSSLCGLICAFNAFIDTYNIFNLPRFIGINYFAVKSENVERLCKPINVIDKKPEVIFLGNSKTDFAIDPYHYTKLTGSSSVYNFAVRNAEPYELYQFITHALNNNPNLNTIFLAIDFEMFITSTEKVAGFDEDQIGKTHITLDNFFKSELSLDALQNNLFALKMNHIKRYDYPSFEDNGKFSDGALGAIFIDEASFLKNTRNFFIMAHESGTLNYEKFKILGDIVKLCDENQINLKVFIPPVHAIHIKAYSAYKNLYEEWLTKLVEIVPVIDFVSCDEIASIDPDLPINDNRYFWDSAHVKTIVGNLMIERLVGKSDNYGNSVNTNNVREHLDNLWQSIDEFDKNFPSISKKCEIIGKFSREIPINLLNNANASQYVKLDHSDIRTVNNANIIRIMGKILIDETQVNNVYLFLKDDEEHHFYTMVSKQWKSGDITWKSLIKDNSNENYYKFFAEAILNGITEGDYDLFIVYEDKDNNLNISPILMNFSLKDMR